MFLTPIFVQALQTVGYKKALPDMQRMTRRADLRFFYSNLFLKYPSAQ